MQGAAMPLHVGLKSGLEPTPAPSERARGDSRFALALISERGCTSSVIRSSSPKGEAEARSERADLIVHQSPTKFPLSMHAGWILAMTPGNQRKRERRGKSEKESVIGVSFAEPQLSPCVYGNGHALLPYILLRMRRSRLLPGPIPSATGRRDTSLGTLLNFTSRKRARKLLLSLKALGRKTVESVGTTHRQGLLLGRVAISASQHSSKLFLLTDGPSRRDNLSLPVSGGNVYGYMNLSKVDPISTRRYYLMRTSQRKKFHRMSQAGSKEDSGLHRGSRNS
ncbi:uncharacterized protein N7459_009143 [Penicillium hispanicum]|uniref:uncharacterized protein n=1 Tax=Penicillium hispanicum TaxID=1080232 RepID=UPI00254148CB|nr:uncharacterized protein N7459_009143 [Penicillium hispanicum]KAJ5569713.1 hypothetical protein N7459_009143 [Penicillium hispanicum]